MLIGWMYSGKGVGMHVLQMLCEDIVGDDFWNAIQMAFDTGQIDHCMVGALVIIFPKNDILVSASTEKTPLIVGGKKRKNPKSKKKCGGNRRSIASGVRDDSNHVIIFLLKSISEVKCRSRFKIRFFSL
ncbi:hypothetical protein RJT34_03464 [Clitoria ternatea]|uniref:Uncharacterized protein n=1 Tax=Clitoria ternatea TaxID=43366 RepID=A0AAN9KM91_CLITE